MTFGIALAFCAFLMSLLGTRLTILALRKRTVLLDLPNARSNHRTPTPRGGGIAVVFTLIICLLIADINYGIVLSILLLAAVSLLDDLIDIPAWVRLLVQAMAVAIPLSMLNIPMFNGFLPPLADKIVTAILWIWFINLFNFMDGIDGISATEMISICSGFCLITILAGTFLSPFSLYALVIAAAGCGFVWWNWHPARIFLGDVGSIPIGFILGYLLIVASLSGYGVAALILPAYYLADSTITLGNRLWRRQKIWQAHSEHYYQKAVRSGRRHDSVVRYILGINFILILLASLSVIDPNMDIFYVGIAYMAVFMLLGFFAHTPHNPHDEHL